MSKQGDNDSSVTLTADAPSDDGALASRTPRERPLKEVPTEEYVVHAEHARGGLGRILRATDRLGRTVALKELIRQDFTALLRFEREARLTARLQHPAIIPVHEAGKWPTGLPFYSMKLVAGKTLKEKIASCGSFDERLALLPNVVAIVEAIAYAHSEGVIHRDLKPSNILIGEFGETVVVDWGLAKDLHLDDNSGNVNGPYRTMLPGDLTQDGSVLGTPAYMAPEQAQGRKVDERADVYALGALLYHVLTGDPPYKGTSSAAVLNAVMTSPPPPLRSVQDAVSPDLAAIVDRAMARNEADRYPTAELLAKDLKLFLAGQLVLSHRYSLQALLWRFLVRYRGPVLLTCLFIAVISAIAVTSVNRILEERKVAGAAREQAQHESQRALAAKAEAELKAKELMLSTARAELRHDPAQAIDVLSSLPTSDPHWIEAQHVAADAWSLGTSTFVARSQRVIVDLAISGDARVVMTSGIHDGINVMNAQTGEVVYRDLNAQPRSPISLSSDGNSWAYETISGKLVIIGPSGRREIDGQPMCLALSSDGSELLTVAKETASLFYLGQYGVVTHVANASLPYPLDSCTIQFDSQSQLATVSGRNHTATFAVSRAGLRLRNTTLGWSTAPDRDGLSFTVAPGGSVSSCVSFKCTTLGNIPPGHWGPPIAYATNKRLALVSKTNVVVYGEHGIEWDVPVGNTPTTVALSTNGRVVAVGLADGDIRCFEKMAGQIGALRGHGDGIVKLLFAQDEVLLSGSLDGTSRIWNLGSTPWGHALIREDTYISQVLFYDSETIIYAGGHGTVVRVGLSTGQSTQIKARGSAISNLALSNNRRWLVASDDDGSLWTMDLRTGVASSSPARHVAINDLAFSADDRSIFAIGMDGVLVQHWLEQAESTPLVKLGSGGSAVATSRDGSLVAIGDLGGDVAIYDMTGHRLGGSASPQEGTVYDLAFLNDSSGVVAAHESGAVMYYRANTEGGAVLHRGDSRALRIAIAPDNRWAVGDDAGDIYISGPRSILGPAKSGIYLHGHSEPIYCLKFMSDGQALLSASLDRTLRLWDTGSGAVTVFRGHQDGISYFASSQNEDAFVSASFDHTLRLWPLDVLLPPKLSEGLAYFRSLRALRPTIPTTATVPQDVAGVP